MNNEQIVYDILSDILEIFFHRVQRPWMVPIPSLPGQGWPAGLGDAWAKHGTGETRVSFNTFWMVGIASTWLTEMLPRRLRVSCAIWSSISDIKGVESKDGPVVLWCLDLAWNEQESNQAFSSLNLLKSNSQISQTLPRSSQEQHQKYRETALAKNLDILFISIF